jgi:cytochrome bd-type quinol oxidase subunit 1
MLRWGLGLVAVLIPIQMVFGHLNGEYVLHHQPAKFAAIEARWKTQQPASETFIAIPDPASPDSRQDASRIEFTVGTRGTGTGRAASFGAIALALERFLRKKSP